MRPRRGVTLVELLVVIALLGVIGAVAALAMRAPAAASPSDAAVRLAAIRDYAVRIQRPVTVVSMVGGLAVTTTAYPDGRVIDERLSGVNPLSGRVITRAP